MKAHDKNIVDLDPVALIEIIDNPGNTDKATIREAKQELFRRPISSTQIEELAVEANRKIANEIIVNQDLSEKEITIHQSKFLNEEEIKQIYIEELEAYIKYKDQFRFDVWKFAIGGIV